MECLSHRISFVTWRIHVFRPLLKPDTTCYSSRRISVSSQRNLAPEEPEKNSSSTVDSATNDTRPSQKLPQSPLIIHPRHGIEKKRKPRATAEDKNPLSKNPWAVALATPTRMCSITGVRIPCAFMEDWGLVRRPDSDQLYLLPVGLLQNSLRGAEKPYGNQVTSPSPRTAIEQQDLNLYSEGENNKGEHGADPPTTQKTPPTAHRLVLRIVNHLPLLQALSIPFAYVKKYRNKRHPALKLLPFRWKHPWGPLTAREEKRITWMEDTPNFVHRSMQAELVRKLDESCSTYKRIGVANGVWKVLDLQECSDAALAEALAGLDAFERMGCGAILLLGSEKADTNAEKELEQFESPEYITLPQTQSKVPVFDLPRLLLDEDLQKLRDSHAHFQHPALFFRPDNPGTVKTMLSLWAIKQFLGGYTQPRP